MRSEKKKNGQWGMGVLENYYTSGEGGGEVLFPSFILPLHRSTAVRCHRRHKWRSSRLRIGNAEWVSLGRRFSYSSSFFSLLIQRREINCWAR